MRLVAYTRLSQANDREEESHDDQRERIGAWSGLTGHEVVGHHRDTVSGVCGADDRPGFVEALEAVSEGEADGVVVRDLTRLARMLTTQEALLAAVWSRGGRVFVTGAGEVYEDDPEDPMRTAMRQMAGVFSQLERAMIAKRMADGRRRAVRDGRLIGPAPAFGWLRDPDDRGRPVPDPVTFPLAREAMRRREAGESLRAVGGYLTLATGRTWHPTSVKRLVERFERYGSAA